MLTGCDGVFGLTHIPDRTDAQTGDSEVVIDGREHCEQDMFPDLTTVLTRWDRATTGVGFDVNVEAGELVVRVPANMPGLAYVRHLANIDMTEATLTVEVPRAIGLIDSETFFSVMIDDTNFYFFDVVNGQLTMRVRSLNVDKHLAMMSYDSAAHRFWRFEHDKVLGQMRFFTSSDGTSFTMRHSMPTDVAVGPMTIELGAATINTGLAVGSEAHFDNLEYCPP